MEVWQAVQGRASDLPCAGLSFLTCQMKAAVASTLEESWFIGGIESLVLWPALEQRMWSENYPGKKTYHSNLTRKVAWVFLSFTGKLQNPLECHH